MNGRNVGGLRDEMNAQLRRDFLSNLHVKRNKYTVRELIGEGAYGVVCSAVDNETGELVAIKRIMRVFDHAPEGARILRELKLLRLLGGHENVITVRGVLLPNDRDKFNDVFVVFELMPTDLNRILRSKIALSTEHIRWLTYQIVRVLHYLHTSRIFHRDLKPSNILVNADCDVRLCDFGLARVSLDTQDPVFWTDYVATRWYRAPELIMSWRTTYSTAIDMWGLGCILGEMLNNGEPLFPGTNGYHQLELIRDVLGSPDAETMRSFPQTNMKDYFTSLPPKTPRRPSDIFPNAPADSLSFLGRLLQLHPERRPTAEEALRDPYFKGIFQEEDAPQTAPQVDHEFAFEREGLTEEKLRQLFVQEILSYHSQGGTGMADDAMPESDQLRFDVPSQASQFRQQFNEVRVRAGP